MSKCKYGGGIAASKSRKAAPTVAPVAQQPPQEPEITLQDLPLDILRKIFIDHGERGTGTYSEQLVRITEIVPELAKESMAPEEIEVFKRTGEIQTFTNLLDFKTYSGKDNENLLGMDLIRMSGKSVHVVILNQPFLHHTIFINIKKPDETKVLASLTMKYMDVKKNPLHISIYNVSLTIFPQGEELPDINFINDIIVGASWLRHVFNKIQCIDSFSFSRVDNIKISITVDNFQLTIDINKVAGYTELMNKLLLLLSYVEKNVIQKKIRMGGRR